MWKSRVRREISKSLWKPVCGFHGDVISIAVFAVPDVIEADAKGDAGPLPTCRSSFLAPPTRSLLIDRRLESLTSRSPLLRTAPP